MNDDDEGGNEGCECGDEGSDEGGEWLILSCLRGLFLWIISKFLIMEHWISLFNFLKDGKYLIFVMVYFLTNFETKSLLIELYWISDKGV